MQARGDQGCGVVVEPFVEIRRRARRMLVGRCAQFGARLSGEGGQKCGVEVDRMQFPVPADDDVCGFQVAVGAVVGDHAGGQGVERLRKAPELCRVACESRFGGRFVQGHALDPVAQNRVDPDARFRRGVEEKFFFQQFVAVNLPQVAHFAPGSSCSERMHPLRRMRKTTAELPTL